MIQFVDRACAILWFWDVDVHFSCDLRFYGFDHWHFFMFVCVCLLAMLATACVTVGSETCDFDIVSIQSCFCLNSHVQDEALSMGFNTILYVCFLFFDCFLFELSCFKFSICECRLLNCQLGVVSASCLN